MSVLVFLALAVVAFVLALFLMLRKQVSRAGQFASKDEENFKKLFEEVPLACQEIDVYGVIRLVNQKLCDLRGQPASSIVGKHYSDFVPESDRARARDEIHRKLSGEKPLAPGQQTFVRGDREVVTVQVQDVLLRDEAGAVVGLRSYELDVTERIRKEEEIWQTTGELRAIFQALPDVFLRMDPGGVI